MLFRLLGTTIMLGVITGFVELSKGAFFRTLGGQIVQGVIGIACFILVGVAFWQSPMNRKIAAVLLISLAIVAGASVVAVTPLNP